jgi:uncharacterized damage-inducible protein DinB
MSETARVAALLRQAWDGEPGHDAAWHGPSLRKLLEGVTAAQAANAPVAGAHTIWELVLHIAVWDEICTRRLRGEVIRATTGSPEDWPPVGALGAEAWRDVVARLERAQATLAEAVESLAEERLDDKAAGCEWTNHRMIHGTLHHDLYHAGQIAVLRRAL